MVFAFVFGPSDDDDGVLLLCVEIVLCFGAGRFNGVADVVVVVMSMNENGFHETRLLMESTTIDCMYCIVVVMSYSIVNNGRHNATGA